MILSWLYFSLCFWAKVQETTSLTIDVSNVQPNAGNVMIAVHQKHNFLKNRTTERVVTAAANSTTVTINLQPGEYAIAVYQDKNQNQKLDTNTLGIPQEAYGFSNNIRPKFRAPTFAEAKIILQADAKKVSIQLRNW